MACQLPPWLVWQLLGWRGGSLPQPRRVKVPPHQRRVGCLHTQVITRPIGCLPTIQQKIELKKIGKDVDVFHELEKQHEACRASFSDLYGAEQPTKLQPVVTLAEEYIAKGVSVMMQMDPAWHPEGICGVQRLEGAVPGADWAAIDKATQPDNPIMLFQGMQKFAEADIVLMPLYYYSHFIVVVFFVAAGCIVYFDSINKGRFKVSTAQEAVLVEFAQRFIINKKWEVQQGSFEQQRDSFTCGYRAFILCRTFYNARDMNYTRDIDMSGVSIMDEVKKIQTMLTEVSTKAKIK
ncbi:hypothetical protein V8C86DRAFT_2442307, partial [Haematococcus lacustris]